MAEALEPIGKACACLVDTRGRLLVFDHPADGGMQLPKGTIEAGESPEDAVRRELLEESGIRFEGPLEPLGTLHRFCAGGVEGNRHDHDQRWHLFLMRSTAAWPERFPRSPVLQALADGELPALEQREDGPTVDEIHLRVLEALADEARRILDEGVVPSAAELDACLLLGAGFPFFRGGITPYLDLTGISERVGGRRLGEG